MMEENIAAIATAAGKGGVAIIRISGKNAAFPWTRCPQKCNVKGGEECLTKNNQPPSEVLPPPMN